MSSAARVEAAGTALEREAQTLRTFWDASRADAHGGMLDAVQERIVFPYIAHLRQASSEIHELAAAAARAESLLSS